MSEKNQIKDFVKLNFENEDYMQKIKILIESTEKLIERVSTGSTNLSWKLKLELGEFKNFLDQVSFKLEKIKEERENLKVFDERFEAMGADETTESGSKICLKLDNFRDYETVCGSKLFFMDSSEIWPELGKIYYKFVDETNDLPIEKRMPMISLWRFMNILTDHFKEMGYNPEFAQVLFLTKIFFDALELRGFENPSFHVKKLLKRAFIEPVTPTSEMSVYGLELNIQLTNLLYDIFAMCVDGKMRTKCLVNFARRLKIVNDQPKKIIESEAWLKEAFISQVELFCHELFENQDEIKKRFQEYLDDLEDLGNTFVHQDYLFGSGLFGNPNRDQDYAVGSVLLEALKRNCFEDYLGNKNISVKNKLAFICGLTGVGYINFEKIQEYFYGADSIDLRIFICTHGLTHFPGYRTIFVGQVKSAMSEVKSSFIFDKTLDFKAKPFNDELVNSPAWKLDDSKLGSLKLDYFLKFELNGYGSKELSQEEKIELAKGCYCYKEMYKSNCCRIRLMFNCKFDTSNSLLMEQNTSALETAPKPFESKILKFLALGKEGRNIEDLKNIFKVKHKLRYGTYGLFDHGEIFDGIVFSVFELYGLLKESDKTFKNLYDFLTLFLKAPWPWHIEEIKAILEHLFGKKGEKLREIGDKIVNVENIFKYTNFSLFMPCIFYYVKRSDITEETILNYIGKLALEKRSGEDDYGYDRRYLKRISRVEEVLECFFPTSIHKVRPTLTNFEKQNDFYKLVTYKYLSRHYRKDLNVFKKLPMKFGSLYIEELDLKDPKSPIGMEVYKLLGSNNPYVRGHISSFNSSVQNVMFADLEENSRGYYYIDLNIENRNLYNLRLIPEYHRGLCFRDMDSKYRTAENLKYTASDDRDVVFACYLTPEETTYENFVKYLDKAQRKSLSFLYNAKTYKKRIGYSNFSREEKEKKIDLLNQFKEWYKKSLSLDDNNKNKKNKGKGKEKANEISLIGKKVKSDGPLDTEKQSAKKMPKLENNPQKNKDDKDNQGY